jgi:hypothetical protein
MEIANSPKEIADSAMEIANSPKETVNSDMEIALTDVNLKLRHVGGYRVGC